MQAPTLPLLSRQHSQQNVLALVEQVQARNARESQTIISGVRPRERAVGRHEVRVPDDRCICQVRSNLVFGQPSVVLRNEKALDGSFEDLTSVLARLVWWPKMIGSLLAYQRVGYPELSAQVAEVEPVVIVALRDDYQIRPA